MVCLSSRAEFVVDNSASALDAEVAFKVAWKAAKFFHRANRTKNHRGIVYFPLNSRVRFR